jgi:5-methylcytosine-specific restriction endonuclease McrA
MREHMHEYTLSQVSDTALLRDLAALVAKDRLTTARILAHIAEVDARRLYAPAGYRSMFAFCVEELRLSEDAAYKRIQAARAGRKFPALFGAVAEGRLHLTAVFRLAPHLTAENVEELIQEATHRPKVEVEAMLARRFPAPEASAPLQVVRAIPCPPRPQLVPGPVQEIGAGDAELVLEPVGETAPDVQLPMERVDGTNAAPAILPSPDRYLLQLAIGKATHDKLRHAQALLAHAVPSGDVAVVLDRALDALIGHLEKRRFGTRARVERNGNGRASRPRPAGVRPAGVGKRYIPARVRRAVWERDGGRCTFVSARGHRCTARRFLQFDHVLPVARGGTATVEGVRLLCRAHNQYEADRVFGAGFMHRKRTEQRTALTRARVKAQEEHADLLAGLRSLGCRGEMARRAVEHSQTHPGATLEERLRAALQSIGRASVRGGTRVGSATAPPSG